MGRGISLRALLSIHIAIAFTSIIKINIRGPFGMVRNQANEQTFPSTKRISNEISLLKTKSANDQSEFQVIRIIFQTK